jgi:hypothetical protein
MRALLTLTRFLRHPNTDEVFAMPAIDRLIWSLIFMAILSGYSLAAFGSVKHLEKVVARIVPTQMELGR